MTEEQIPPWLKGMYPTIDGMLEVTFSQLKNLQKNLCFIAKKFQLDDIVIFANVEFDTFVSLLEIKDGAGICVTGFLVGGGKIIKFEVSCQ